jgi:hypothetical protein
LSVHLFGEALQNHVIEAMHRTAPPRVRESVLRGPSSELASVLEASPAPPRLDRRSAAILRRRTDLPPSTLSTLHRFERQLASLPTPIDPGVALYFSLSWSMGFLVDAIAVLSEARGRLLPGEGALAGLALLESRYQHGVWDVLTTPAQHLPVPQGAHLRASLEGLLLLGSVAASLRLFLHVSSADPRPGDGTRIRRLALHPASFVPAERFPSLWRFCADPVRS